MTQEEKKLLLTDLCGRLMYGVKCKVFDFATPYTLSGVSPDLYEELYFTQLDFKESDGYAGVKFCKPYLFPMSNMTKEQKIMIRALQDMGLLYYHLIIEHYNEWHLDYRGLIPMGLANDATGLNIY